MGAAEAIAEASLALASRFTSGRELEPPQVTEPGAPWANGVLGPDLE